MKARRTEAIPRGLAGARAELTERLRARREEIEEAMRARTHAIADPGEVADPAYAQGLTSAISAALEYGLEGLGASEGRPPAVPVALIAQARLAARNRIGIDTVLRRYLAGHTLLGHFLVQEAAELGLSGAALKGVMRAEGAAFERLVAAISEEHSQEARPPRASAERRRLHLVQCLLAGEPAEATELRYPFEAHHLGLLCIGPGAEEALREIAAAVDHSLLAVHPDPDTVWAWLGGIRAPDVDGLSRLAGRKAPEGTTIAVGEPATALAGWRLTHRQAAAALPVALRSGDRAVRYADVALIAAVLQNEMLATSLRRLYLEPLEGQRDGGAIARETLRAYFAADRNVSAASASLGVSRPTVKGRLRSIEKSIGMPVHLCVAEVETALRLQELEPQAPAGAAK